MLSSLSTLGSSVRRCPACVAGLPCPADLPSDDPHWSFWHNGAAVEMQVVCGDCDQDMGCLSAYVTLDGDGHASDIALGRDRPYNPGRKMPGSDRSEESDDPRAVDAKFRALQAERPGSFQSPAQLRSRRFTLVCSSRRCRFRQVVKYERAGAAMVAAWRRGSYKLVAGADI